MFLVLIDGEVYERINHLSTIRDAQQYVRDNYLDPHLVVTVAANAGQERIEDARWHSRRLINLPERKRA